MLHILLWILKIIGILLAVVVGILLVAIVCVLFVPIRYTVKTDGKLGEEQPLRARVKVSWLLHIVNAAFLYPEAPYLKVRVFCFTVYDSSKKKDEEEPKQEADEDTKVMPEDAGAQAEVTDRSESIKQKVIDNPTIEEPAKLQQNNDETAVSDSEVIEEKQGITEKIQAFIQVMVSLWKRFIGALKNIEYTIRKICDKIKQIVENIQYYMDVLKSDVFQRAWQDCKKQLLRILRMLKPSKCRVNLLLGTGDPGSTGQIWSVYGMLYPMIGNNVSLQTDFDNQIVEGDLYIKGKVKIWVLVWAAFKLYRDKDLRHLLKLLKREEM